ncbi:formin 13 isoform X1 [Labeo rohita]|uniref:Formin 13 isoform X1 n=1 Tax=Labeo rohita TaxID=84645 RepID=A0A498L9F8_LABRO|nr:formin 13 isoform X1 [Labeo rohita]
MDYRKTVHVPQEKQSQYNFSVRKFNRYIWQKRVLQIDFSTSLLCSIEKGIVKRQLCFSDVKNCHDGPGTRFSISFRDRSDYELEAASLEDKQQVEQYVIFKDTALILLKGTLIGNYIRLELSASLKVTTFWLPAQVLNHQAWDFPPGVIPILKVSTRHVATTVQLSYILSDFSLSSEKETAANMKAEVGQTFLTAILLVPTKLLS